MTGTNLFLVALGGLCIPGLSGVATGRSEVATDVDRPPTWADDVRPILAEHCFECHGPDPDTRSAGLRLDTGAGLFGRGGGPAAVVPGDIEESELLYRAASEDEFDRMPPPEHGPGLSEAEVETLTAWIEAGADWQEHWAYAPLRVPKSREAAGRDLDGWIEQGLDAAGRKAAPPAAPTDLLRRLHLDLVGMPPTIEEVEAFLMDTGEAAYAEEVDRLLSSTAHAEHWAKQWLDAARYADSHGFTIDGGRTVWPWRDWVVASIARDQPFDEFTIEQLAGDLLPGATRDQRIATGFHRNTQVNQEGGAKDEENRISAVMDRVATTGAVWLGATVACAQCHTHKFDPITQTEYFGLFAFFDSTRDGGVSAAPSVLVPSNEEEAAAADAWEQELARLGGVLGEARAAAAAGWTLWQPARATGSNGPELRPEENGSFRVVGQNPVYSTYVLEGGVGLGAIGTLRLEVLPDGGPGRARNRNFVLQEVRVAVQRGGAGSWEDLAIADARADFEQDTTASGGGSYPVRGVIPGVDGPGWAIRPDTGAPHAAEFDLVDPARLGPGDVVRVELVQEFGANHTIGSFRTYWRDKVVPGASAVIDANWRAALTAYLEHRGARPRMATTLVLEERATPRVTRRFHRGSFLDPREVVEPGVPLAMDGFRTERRALGSRLDLARWLVDPRNALVQRVTVNRWWQAFFGEGLVSTENDFGLRGARPVNPAVLDWLAGELVRSGYSRRHVLRTIVMSKAYRRSAAAGPEAGSAEAAASPLERQRRLRLSGEQLRDSMLRVAGVLDGSVGGPPVQPPQPDGVYAFTQSAKTWTPSEGAARYRRSLYTRIWRSAPFPFFTTFDAPAPNVACTRRGRSMSPLQALALANDPMVIELAGHFGARIEREAPGAGDAERVEFAFRAALGRSPEAAEAERLVAYVARERERSGDTASCAALARVLFNLGEFTHRP